MLEGISQIFIVLYERHVNIFMEQILNAKQTVFVL
jgi:hypothetical protein